MKYFSNTVDTLLRSLFATIAAAFCVLCPSFAQGQAIHRAPHDAEAHACFHEGAHLLEKGQPANAIEAFDRCISFAPGYDEAYLERALARKQIHDWQGAHTDYSIYLERVPDQAEALFGRATVRFALCLYEMAKQDFLRLLMLSPAETTSVFYALDQSGRTNGMFTAQGGMKHAIYNYLGLIASHSADYEQALRWYDSAILRNPVADYFVNRALAHEAIGDSLAAADDYQRAIEIDPANSLARYNMAQAAMKAGQFTLADGYLTQAIADNPDLSYTWSERGVFRIHQDDLPGAISDLSQALVLNPADYDTWFNRGLAYERLGLLQAAYVDFTEAIERRPDLDRAWLSRGNVLFRQGRFSDAVQDYTAAIHYKADYAQAYYNRAIVYDRTNKNIAACRDLQRAEALGMAVPHQMHEKFCKTAAK